MATMTAGAVRLSRGYSSWYTSSQVRRNAPDTGMSCHRIGTKSRQSKTRPCPAPRELNRALRRFAPVPKPVPGSGRGLRRPAGFRRSELDLQTVVGDRDAQGFSCSRDFLVTQGLAPYLRDAFVVVGRFVVEKHQVFHIGKLTQLDPDYIARMAPVLLHRHGLGERVHGVEDHQVGVGKKSGRAFDRIRYVQPVLRIGRIHDDPAVADESIAVGVTGMALELCGYAPPCDLVAPPRLECNEFYRGPEAIERHRETGRVLLPAKRFFEIGVAAVNPDLVSGDVGRSEKRKTHDVVPVKMGLEHVEDVGLGGAVSAEYMISEDAYAAAEIAQYVFVITRIELHAGGIATEGVRNRKTKVGVHPRPRFFMGVEALTRSRDQRMREFVPDRRGVEGDGDGTARSPERDPQRHRSGAMGGVVGRQSGWRNFGQSFAHGSKTLEHEIEAADLEDFAHHGLERRYHDRPPLLADLLGRQHQDAQPDAADVVHLRKIQDQAIAPCAAAGYIGVEPGLQPVGGAVIDAPDRGEHQGVAIAFLGYVHGTGWPSDG